MKYLIGSLVIIGIIVLCYFYCRNPKPEKPGTKTPDPLPPVVNDSEPIDSSSNEGQIFDPNNIVVIDVDRQGSIVIGENARAIGGISDSKSIIDLSRGKITPAIGTANAPMIDTNPTTRN